MNFMSGESFQLQEMANHRRILEHVKTHEGGYSADPVDNASNNPSPAIGLDKRYPNLPVHTYRGVTWTTWLRYATRKGFTATGDNFVKMTLAQWEDLLKSMYWDSFLGDKIKSQGIAEMIFESVWGGGATTFNRNLQEFLKSKGYEIKTDGAIGPKTVDALNKFTSSPQNERELILHMTNKRLQYLQQLDDWWKYQRGWSARVKEMKDRAIAYISENPTITGGGLLVAIVAAFLYTRYAN